VYLSFFALAWRSGRVNGGVDCSKVLGDKRADVRKS